VLSGGVVAGHDTSHNYGSAGVALLGDATLPDWPMPQASGPMWDALARYCTFEAGRHGLRPLASDGSIAASDFLRSDGTWTDAMRNVSGHRETNATTCPGDVVMALLPSLRSVIQAGLADTSRSGVALTNTAPGGRQAKVGSALRYTWSLEPPESGWSLVGYETLVEGWSKSSRSDDVTYLSGYTAESQPRPAWQPAGTATSLSFTPKTAGHYTVHVRAILQGPSGQRRAAYEANHTFLVT
jgi:hypothetical protein